MHLERQETSPTTRPPEDGHRSAEWPNRTRSIPRKQPPAQHSLRMQQPFNETTTEPCLPTSVRRRSPWRRTYDLAHSSLRQHSAGRAWDDARTPSTAALYHIVMFYDT